MKLSEIKNILPQLDHIAFQLEDGTFVPEHFHVTEIGQIQKSFIDCGGTIRHEKNISFQLWNANDFEHRLKPEKLLHIIQLSEEKLDLQDGEVEIEYQQNTIAKFDVAFNGENFVLKNKQTACLAEDSCGITPSEKPKIQFATLGKQACTPGAGCC